MSTTNKIWHIEKGLLNKWAHQKGFSSPYTQNTPPVHSVKDAFKLIHDADLKKAKPGQIRAYRKKYEYSSKFPHSKFSRKGGGKRGPRKFGPHLPSGAIDPANIISGKRTRKSGSAISNLGKVSRANILTGKRVRHRPQGKPLPFKLGRLARRRKG
mgnify:CR=1 FL=1